MLLGGPGWVIATEKESMDKKQLAAVIELTGEFLEKEKLLRQRRKRTSTKSARSAGV